MQTNIYPRESFRHWARLVARVVAMTWALWWLYFGIASGIGEGLDLLGIVIHTTVPGLIFLVIALIAWRWERAGGAVLLVMGSFVLVAYPLAARSQPILTTFLVLLTMALPPLIAGSLFLAIQRPGLTDSHAPEGLV